MLNIVFYSILLQNICFLNGVFDIYSFRSIGLIEMSYEQTLQTSEELLEVYQSDDEIDFNQNINSVTSLTSLFT